MAEGGNSPTNISNTPPVKPAKAPVADAIENDQQVKSAVDANVGETEEKSKLSQAKDKAKQAVKKEASALKEQATGKAREAAGKGKGKAVSAAGSLSTIMGDAAGSIDEKFGTEYGDYARTAKNKFDEAVGKFDQTDIDELVAMASDFVRKQPAVALGIAAAAGFVFVRLLKADDEIF